MPDGDLNQLRLWAEQSVQTWWRLGYDYYRARAEIPFHVNPLAAKDTSSLSSGDRQWVNEHQGLITSEADVEDYPWPTRADINFAPTELVIDRLPEGMRRSFGKSVSRAARIKKGLTVIEIQTNKEYIDIAKKALKVGESNISVNCKIEIRDIDELTIQK